MSKEIIGSLKQKFIAGGIKTIDSKNRITLSDKISKIVMRQTDSRNFQIYYGEDGDILLRPMVSIPSKEAWIYRNPDILKSIKQGLKDAKEKKTKKIDDVDKFLKTL